MAMILYPNNSHIDVEPDNDQYFELAQLQAIVDGYIEIVDLGAGNILVINEEGKLKGLPINQRATQLFNHPHDVIVGPALLCKKSEVR